MNHFTNHFNYKLTGYFFTRLLDKSFSTITFELQLDSLDKSFTKYHLTNCVTNGII